MTQQKQRKLVITTSTFPRWSGDSLPRFVLDHAIGMKEFFSDVVVIAPHYKGAKRIETMEGISVVRFRYAPARFENIVYEGHASKKAKKSFGYTLKLFCLVVAQTISVAKNARGADIINAHWLIPQGFIALLTRPFNKTKIVVTVHGGDVFTLNGGLFTRVKRYVLKNADAVVVNSSETQTACKQLYNNKDYPIIPMGVDIESIAKTKVAARNDNKKVILFVGRLSSEKGVIYLCKAAKLLPNNVEVRIVGEGPQKPNITEYVKNNKLESVVTLRGWLQSSQVHKELKMADIFVGPSIHDDTGWREAFGLVFVEAAAAGLPVVATNTGGIKDIVIDGETGFLVKQKDPKALAAKINLLLADKKLSQKMSTQAIHKSKEFSQRQSTQKYQDVFKKLTEPAPNL